MNEETCLQKSELSGKGITLLTECTRPDRASSVANSYIFQTETRTYVLDTGCGRQRSDELKSLLSDVSDFHILSSHYHNDHVSNNGRIASVKSRIIFHNKVRGKIRYLRTNGTGQITMMAREMNLEGMLKRFRMFPQWLIRILVYLDSRSVKLPYLFLFIVSYFYSLKNIGRIYPALDKVVFLEDDSVSQEFSAYNVKLWKIDADLYAFYTPGHTDDHLVFYLKERRILFAGDCLNFLNPNDIQFGNISQTMSTLDFIIDFVRNQDVDILAQGHYLPLTGNADILKHLTDLREKHKKVYDSVVSCIKNIESPFSFDDVLDSVFRLDDDIVRRLVKIAFPRSTLVFLDVFVLMVLKEMGFKKGPDDRWRV